MPNLDPWINQFENDQGITTIATTTTATLEEEKNKFENYLLFVKTECQKTIERNSHQHPKFLEHYQKVIEMIDWWTFDRENEEKGISNICNMCGFTNDNN
jgi:hypothetical protein